MKSKTILVSFILIMIVSCSTPPSMSTSLPTSIPLSAITPTHLPNTPTSTPTPVPVAIVVSPSDPYSHKPGVIYSLGEYKFREMSSFGSYTVPNILPIDLDQDSDIDLIVTSEENDSIIQVYENLGDAVFRNSGTVFSFHSSDPRHWNFGITAADFNEDGLPDIATADAWAGLNIYFNLGNLQFALVQNYVFPGMGEVKGITSTDLNLDKHIDIILGDHNGDSRGDRILMNDGNGQMVDTLQSINWDVTWDVFAIDINRDGAPDYVSVNRYAEKPSKINFNNGSGKFSKTIELPDSLDDSYDVKCFAQPDYTYCFIANSEGTEKRSNRILIFDKQGVLIEDRKFGEVGSETKDLCLVDINSDGILDLITGNYNYDSSAFIAELGTNGILGFGKVIPLFSIEMTTAIGCADFNNDGLLDLIVGVVSRDGTRTQYKLILQQPSLN